MPDAAPSVAVIGSFRRHYEYAKGIATRFIDCGVTVTTPPIGHIVNPGADFVRFEGDPDTSIPDWQIQAAVFERIFDADGVYVAAPGGYIGPTTCYEIGRLIERDQQPVFFSAPPTGSLLCSYPMVASVEAVAARLHLSARYRRRLPSGNRTSSNVVA